MVQKANLNIYGAGLRLDFPSLYNTITNVEQAYFTYHLLYIIMVNIFHKVYCHMTLCNITYVVLENIVNFEIFQ